MQMKRNFGPQGLGLSSLMVVFLVLSLVIFAALSLSTAKNDYNLTLQLAEHRTEYYEAVSLAEQIMAQADSLHQAGEPMPAQLLGISLDAVGSLVRYRVPIGDSQELRTEVELGETLTVKRFQVCTIDPWDAEQTLNLLVA